MADILKAAKNMDWKQVVLNGGPPCFRLEKDGHFCGRAERWHEKGTHEFVSLEDLLAGGNINPAQTLAEGIKAIADAMAEIKKTGVKQCTIIALIHAKTGLAKRDIEAVLDSLNDMAKDWLQP